MFFFLFFLFLLFTTTQLTSSPAHLLSFVPFLLAFFRYRGVGQFPNASGTFLGDFLVSILKGRTLLLPRFWGVLNQKAPPTLFDFDNDLYGSGYDEGDIKRVASLLKIEEADVKKLVETPAVVQHHIQADHT